VGCCPGRKPGDETCANVAMKKRTTGTEHADAIGCIVRVHAGHTPTPHTQQEKSMTDEGVIER